MDLTDICPLPEWVSFEKEIHRRSGMEANVFNIKGVRITDNKVRVNKLCPEIKATDKGQSFICAVAHMNMAGQSQKTKSPVVEECDAGLVKIVVPIFVKDAFLGAVGACGLLLDDGEIDTFAVSKITEIEENKVETLSQGIGNITAEKAYDLIEFIKGGIRRITMDFERRKKEQIR